MPRYTLLIGNERGKKGVATSTLKCRLLIIIILLIRFSEQKEQRVEKSVSFNEITFSAPINNKHNKVLYAEKITASIHCCCCRRLCLECHADAILAPTHICTQLHVCRVCVVLAAAPGQSNK